MFGPRPLKPYDATLTPGKQSTPLALFKSKPQPLPNADLSTLSLREARCEIQSKDTPNPWQMAIAKNVIAVQGVGGYKERNPTLDLYKPGMTKDEWDEHGRSHVNPGHVDITTRLVLDQSRSLVWTADGSCIKSTEYSFDGLELQTSRVHSLASAGFEGPIALIDNGARLLRAEKLGLAVWDVDTAPRRTPVDAALVARKCPAVLSSVLGVTRTIRTSNNLEALSLMPQSTLMSLS